MDSLTELINAAQTLLESGLDLQAFFDWRIVAFLSLLSLLGPLHYYTRTFSRLTREAKQPCLLAGKGILVAAREQVSEVESASRTNEASPSETNEPEHSKLKPRQGDWCPLCLAQEAYKG